MICLTPGITQELDLQAHQRLLNKSIDKSNAYLNGLESDQLNTIQQLVILKENIANREALIHSYQESAQLEEAKSIQLRSSIDSLAKLSESSKLDYYTLMAEVHKKNKIISPAQLLFSQNAFQSLIRRNVLVSQYESYIKNKEKEYLIYQASYDSLLLISENAKQNNLNLRDSSIQEQVLLKERYKSLRSLEENLESKAADIKSAIAITKRERLNVNNSIETYIQSNIDEKANNPTNFFAKYSLPWPIDGSVVSKFGRHRHPTLQDIFVINNGIDIAPYSSRTVKSCSDGEVIKIENLQSGYLILIQHQQYYILYSQLAEVRVSKGDLVSINTTLGEIAEELHFEIWDGKAKENPLEWLSQN